MSAINCWEFKKCGRQPGGDKAADLGTCVAATNIQVSGVNRGRNGGRACWALSGTLCGGAVQGTFATKLNNCLVCEFYQLVRKEEGSQFVPSTEILKLLR